VTRITDQCALLRRKSTFPYGSLIQSLVETDCVMEERDDELDGKVRACDCGDGHSSWIGADAAQGAEHKRRRCRQKAQPSSIANALDIPQRVRSCGPHNVGACHGYRRPAAGTDEVARHAANGCLACHANAAPHDLVADPAPCCGDLDLGLVLFVARMYAQCGAAFYFSGVTYTTLGYGDVVLAEPWRLLAPVEGLMGVLMCGLSTGYFFVVLSRIHQSQPANATAVSTTDETGSRPKKTEQ
jgi:Ion channel